MARFLVVEDFPPLASAIRLAIVREGHAVVQCHTAKAALALQGAFDHAVLDIDLPDGNGVELAEQLFECDRVSNVVFFTASRDREVLERAARRGLVVDKAAGCNCLMSAIDQLLQPAAYRLAAIAGAPGGMVVEATNRSGMRRKVDDSR
jgi:DNA-binding response OmpR family regulator